MRNIARQITVKVQTCTPWPAHPSWVDLAGQLGQNVAQYQCNWDPNCR